MEFYTFGLGTKTEPNAEIMGGKGAGLCWLSNESVSVPPGFIIPTDVWAAYDKKPKMTMKDVGKEVKKYLLQLRSYFGYMPLLSARSGARVSLPGLLETILNIGIDADNNKFWRNKLGDDCFESSYSRLISMYASVAKGIDKEVFAGKSWNEALVIYSAKTGSAFPSAFDQLMGSIEAVFKSWDGEKALFFRKKEGIPREWGTAVVVQSMVFGNLNDQSGTGVLFTRNPDTGEKVITGEFLINGQGEEVVAGIKTPMSLDMMITWKAGLYKELVDTVLKLEFLKRDMQDIEFTIQDGKLYFLQTRNGKRTPKAALRIAVDMIEEGLLSVPEAAKRVTLKQIDLIQQPQIDPAFKKDPAFTGIGACSGIVTGKPVFSVEDAINCKEPCIFIAKETSPEDIEGIFASKGAITMEGGQTSHCAVLCRGENVPCVVGVGVSIEEFKNKNVVSLDGATGRIWFESVTVIEGSKNGPLTKFSNAVLQNVNAIPVIREVPATKLPQALYHVGTGVFDHISTVQHIISIIEQVDKLYVDVSLSDGPEKEFHLFCAGAIQTFVNHLSYVFENKKDLIVVIGDVQTKLNRISQITDLEGLIMGDGEFIFSSNVSTPAVEWVLLKKKEEGKDVTPLLLGQYSGSTKNVLSIEQALTVLQEM